MKNFMLSMGVICAHFSFGQNCNCDHTLSGLSSTGVNIINASSFTYSPGDVFCIEADTIAGLRLIGFVGSATDPITFINCNGQVVIQEGTYSGISFRESHFIHLTGTGDEQYPYGIHVIESGGGQVGVGVSYLSSDVEIDHIEIENTGFAGIMAKTDPNCSDTLTWRSNGYILENLEIHHNYIHDVGGEGMYIGYTGGYKVVSNVTCGSDYVFGHWLENVDVHHNKLVNTGWDGIQLNLVRLNGRVHDNTITNWGTEEVTYQDFAMSIGGGEYEIYNNYMLSEGSNNGKGMQMISGQSGSKIFNNVFINPKGHAVFMHMRHEYEDSTLGYFIGNNTVITPENSGFFYNSSITQSEDSQLIGYEQNSAPIHFINNFVVDPGSDYAPLPIWKGEQECYFDFNTPSMRNAQLSNIYSNLMTRQIDTVGVMDVITNDYRADDANSWLVDQGTDVSAFGLTFDLQNVGRPVNGLFDLGAYEFASYLGQDHFSNETQVYPNPLSTVFIVSCQTESAMLELYDRAGRLLFQQNLTAGINEVDATDLDPGVYLAIVRDKAGNSNQHKLVKVNHH